MNYDECIKLIDWANEKIPNWYLWATAKPFTWDKLLRLYFRFNPPKKLIKYN